VRDECYRRLHVVIDNGSSPPSHRYCRLEATDADLVPLWYSLPDIWRIRIRKLIRVLPGLAVSDQLPLDAAD